MPNISPRLAFLHLFGLFAFAVSQPLYATLAESPEFFVAHRAGAIEVLLMVVILSVGMPAILAGVELMLGLISKRARGWIHLLFVWVLLGLLCVPTLNRTDAAPTVVLGTAVIAACLATAAYWRSHAVRRFVTIASVAGLAFPLLFVTLTPVSDIVFPDRAVSTVTEISGTTPVVLVVFDEFNPTVLLNSEGQLDSVRYPNFTALGTDGWWFPKATAAHYQTLKALPAILTGQSPTAEAILPSASGYPKNLFTMLGGDYALNVNESITNLCPADLCSTQTEAFQPWILWSDLQIVYLHALVPDAYRQRWLPSLGAGWKGFRRTTASGSTQQENAEEPQEHDETPDEEFVRHFKERIAGDRLAEFGSFVQGIQSGDETLDFLHILLPHAPYEYLPNGERYDSILLGHITGDVWSDEQYLLDLAYQRYMLQVGAVDRMLGVLIERLKEVGKYEDALIIVTADHGRAFRSGEPTRELVAENAPDILHIPMFVKEPRQMAGGRNGRTVSSLDILPTIASAVGARSEWPTAGASIIGSGFPERSSLEVVRNSPQEETLTFSWEHITSVPLLAWQSATFGSGSDIAELTYRALHSGIIGRDVSDIARGDGARAIAVSFDLGDGKRRERGADLPNSIYLQGFVQLGAQDAGREPVRLAFALDDVVETVVPTFRDTSGRVRFAAMVPVSAANKQISDVDVYEVSGMDSSVTVTPVVNPDREKFELVEAQGGEEILRDASGNSIRINNERVSGVLDSLTRVDGGTTFSGWAVDVARGDAATRVVLFACGEFLGAGFPTVPRPDVAESLGLRVEHTRGFTLVVDNVSCDLQRSGLRLFGISADGVAGELRISPLARARLHKDEPSAL